MAAALLIAAALTPAPVCAGGALGDDLARAGAHQYEIMALDAITRGGRSKRRTDRLRNGRCGIAHFDWQWCRAIRGSLGPHWAHTAASVPVQLAEWRRLTARALRGAWAAGWNDDAGLALMGAVANSTGSSGALAIARRCRWDRECFARRYAAGSAHRHRRIAWLRGER